MNIRHNPDLRTLEHRMVKEVIDHRQRLLLYVVCKYLAVLAILSLNLYHFFILFMFYAVHSTDVTFGKRINLYYEYRGGNEYIYIRSIEYFSKGMVQSPDSYLILPSTVTQLFGTQRSIQDYACVLIFNSTITDRTISRPVLDLTRD